MKHIHHLAGCALIVGALTTAPTAADAARQSTQGPPAGTQSGQVTGSTTQPRREGATQKTGGEQFSAADRAFLLDAMEGNKAEVALAQLATQKASSASVKQLARTIEQHHSQANSKLQSLAGNAVAGGKDPALKPAHKQLQDRLTKLTGAAFDQAYAAEMVKEHEADIAKYTKASSQLRHRGLKAYATETLPHLKQHLDQARATNSRATP